MKTFYIMISKNFMKDHPRSGEPTYFKEQILGSPPTITDGFNRSRAPAWWPPNKRSKIHTIRDNYEYWARIAQEVNAGRGVFSLRQWTGSPYNFQRDGSKQEEFLQLTKMGIQKLVLNKYLGWSIDDKESDIAPAVVAANDGLSVPDFKAWFRTAKPNKPMAIIHFTEFRYTNSETNE